MASYWNRPQSLRECSRESNFTTHATALLYYQRAAQTAKMGQMRRTPTISWEGLVRNLMLDQCLLL
jgi:hypothetical protein